MVSFYNKRANQRDWVKGEGCAYKRVRVVPDPLDAVRGPRAHGVVGVVGRAADGSRQEVFERSELQVRR
jgi:hypothetical protein